MCFGDSPPPPPPPASPPPPPPVLEQPAPETAAKTPSEDMTGQAQGMKKYRTDLGIKNSGASAGTSGTGLGITM